MMFLDPWLQPLRAYPPAVVLGVFVITAGIATWVIAKVLKWSIYLLALVLFACATAGFALWLWP